MKCYNRSLRKGFSLEEFVAEKLKEIDKDSRPTRGSGNSLEIGDIYSNLLYAECKQKLTKSNITIDYKKEYLKLLNQLPLDTKKFLIIVTENKEREKFVTMNFNDFFQLVKKAYGEK